MAEINVVPLVDVVMVLLIVFMVTAPLLTRGIDLSLPQTKSNTIKPAKRVVLTIGNDRSLYLNEDKISREQLGVRLRSIKGEAIYLRADQEVPYGEVIHLIDLIKQAGIDDLGLVTDLPKELPR
jgi:biopolymer transport protein TolR